jgi:hypothetical protein
MNAAASGGGQGAAERTAVPCGAVVDCRSKREPLADYLANRDYVSSSQLRRFERMGEKSIGMQTGASFDGSLMGEAMHALLLEPESFDRHYLVLDGSAPASKDLTEKDAMAREWLDAWRWSALSKARDAVLASQQAPLARWLQQGDKELSIYWTDAEGGRWKARPDCFTREIVLDLKTTTDCRADPFARTRSRLRYDYQAVHYLEAVSALTGATPRFVYVALELSSPYALMVHEPTATELSAARTLLQALKRQYREAAARLAAAGPA